jgi:GH15 family glucan-1,4-alpha-glucosidase
MWFGMSTVAAHQVCDQSIGDYAVIGDCRSAAIVSRAGSIDWLCLPHFSSPSLFGALLDPVEGGSCNVTPADPARSSRRYLPGTNVLETSFRTAGGAARLTDAMILPHGPDAQPRAEVLRHIAVDDGEVRLRIDMTPRVDYGRARARLEGRPSGWAWTWGDDWLHAAADAPLEARGGSLHGEFTLRAGESRCISLAYERGDVGIVAPLGVAALERLDDTARWWRAWSERASYQGPDRDAVVRSALVLKLLSHALSGSVVAAPTTSLPEAIGGDRNWDYRYCWLRDAALTMRAFTGLGYLDEARAFLDWLLHATRLTWPELSVLYDVFGRPRLPERELPHWRGYCDSRPVRIGNGAHDQLQLDVYGAVCSAARDFVTASSELTGSEARLLRGFGKTVCRRWREPDNGIWEIRGGRRHWTFSKFMCWVALDALASLAKDGRMRVPGQFESERAALRDTIEQRGFNRELGSYVAVLDEASADASLLQLGCLGYADPRDARMRGTLALIQERLGCNGLLHRYEHGLDGIEQREGAFGICSLWAVDNLAKRGDLAPARRTFDRVMGCANDVGLFAEEIDVATGAPLGNFPQAYTHVGVINAALAMAEQEARR